MANTTTSKIDTREQLLDTAQSLIQKASYDGFSFRDLAEQVGIRKASIYHHFPSKEALAVAMLERAREGIVRWSSSRAGLAPTKQLEAYCFDLYLKWLGAGTRLCPAGAFSSGWSTLPADLQYAVKAVFREQRRFLETALAAGIADGSIDEAHGSASDLAEWLMAAVQGALVTARINFDTRSASKKSCEATFTRLCQQTLNYICHKQA
ncbi:TetR/AcrR family transcriptional regulator [Microbulbifer sp. YPW1]|uniref:TetR/AcrR family transcriptional regulator n=1 Tax=Microbulbifer sp. YPW1 TaxID=2745199 RepID=UPI001598CBF7|nr:TetR/AcrR family transcriptional regulator [Microbulbifer sp. YPW1]QKX17778.1 TetR/AcrR family transcriptional regulator [Microbulbifer sp. YPW1]